MVCENMVTLKAKQRLMKEIEGLMYQYGDEVCIELQGDDCSIALCCDENDCYSSTLK